MKNEYTVTAIICMVLVLGKLDAVSQSFPANLDSIKTILCKKWEVDHALMGDMKIQRGMGAPTIIYEFRTDNNYSSISYSANRRDTIRGKWMNDLKNKNIKLLRNGIPMMVITMNNASELMATMIPSAKDDKDIGQIQLVLKKIP
jgi:hypothetical protein